MTWGTGELVAEGKTKRIWRAAGASNVAIIESKDDITAGDGKKHDVIPGKGVWSTQTTCNIFGLLRSCGILVAFDGRISPTRFIAPLGKMFPLEVVVRRESHGSDLQRNPHLKKGTVYSQLKVEFFLKTSGRKWQDRELVCDDPLIVIQSECEGNNVFLFDPHKPIHGQEPFLKLSFADVFDFKNVDEVFAKMDEIARRTFLVLEKAWQMQGRRLVDFKIEFAIPENEVLINNAIPVDKILIGDVIDNDSWRVLQDGKYIDKQFYRDGGQPSDMAAKLELVARLTDSFALPQQRLIIWTGSEKDDKKPFAEAIGEIIQATLPNVDFAWFGITCSLHKEPVRAYLDLQATIQRHPDSVIIAYIGRSNGAGPTLSANCTIPVITVPASAKDFPEDVWSSLRTPSQVPVLTCLDPKNAVLAAVQILAMRNPYLYMCLRLRQEERLANILAL